MKRLVFAALNITLFLIYTSTTRAETFNFQVLDQHQRPLENAVLEFKVDTPIRKPVREHVVDQVKKRFVPNFLMINSGDSIEFPNSDDIRHHVYSFSAAKPFELKLYAGKPKSPVVFESPGVVVLGCNIHDSMVGYIYISQNAAITTDAEGRAEINWETDLNEVYVWHALQNVGPEERQLIALDKVRAKNDDPNSFVIDIVTSKPAPRDTFNARFNSGGEQ